MEKGFTQSLGISRKVRLYQLLAQTPMLRHGLSQRQITNSFPENFQSYEHSGIMPTNTYYELDTVWICVQSMVFITRNVFQQKWKVT